MAINLDHQRNLISSSSGTLTVDQTGSLVLPKGNTSERPSAPVEGAIRYNSDTLANEQFVNNDWRPISNVEIDITGIQTGQLINWDGTKFVPISREETLSIGGLSDVDIAGVADGDILRWDISTGEFKPETVASALADASISDLGDVDLTGIQPGNILKWDGVKFVAEFREETLELGELSDVDVTGIANNYVLTYVQANNRWEPRSVAAAQGALTEGDAIAFAIALGG